MARYETATTIINRAAKELGLWSATVADPFASANPIAAQLCSLLTSSGQELAQMDWPQLVREHTLTGDGTSTAFDLPSDYRSLVSDTAWDRTNDLRISAPNAQRWQALKASSLGVTIHHQARIISSRSGAHSDQIQFITAPALAESLAFEYQSRSWVQSNESAIGDVTYLSGGAAQISFSGAPSDSGRLFIYIGPDTDFLFVNFVGVGGSASQTFVDIVPDVSDQEFTLTFSQLNGCKITVTPAGNDSFWFVDLESASAPAYSDSSTASSNIVLFDPLLATRALKLAFKREKGLDTTTAKQDYRDALDRCRGDLIIGATLSLSGGDGERLIDGRNLPETGYGS